MSFPAEIPREKVSTFMKLMKHPASKKYFVDYTKCYALHCILIKFYDFSEPSQMVYAMKIHVYIHKYILTHASIRWKNTDSNLVG